MKTVSTIVTTVAMGMALSGCQMLFGQKTAGLDREDKAAEALANKDAVNPALEQGRQLLAAGRVAQAIEVLRVAQRDPDAMADASNALGVAYAKLGRHDLADRYFRMAIALQPGDARFAANMLRHQRYHRLAQRRSEEAAMLAHQAAEADRLAKARAANPGQMERLSRGEVRINTQARPAAVAPQTKVFAMHESKPVTPEAEQAAVAAEAVQPEQKGPASRTIDLRKRSGVTVGAPAGDASYPVRVYIGA